MKKSDPTPKKTAAKKPAAKKSLVEKAPPLSDDQLEAVSGGRLVHRTTTATNLDIGARGAPDND